MSQPPSAEDQLAFLFRIQRILTEVEHLARWTKRNSDGALIEEFEREALPHDLSATTRVASWAYAQAERSRAQLWVTGRDGLEFLPDNWRSRAGWPAEPTRQRGRLRNQRRAT